MARTEKLRHRLEVLEADMVERVEPLLRRAAVHRTMIFCVQRYNQRRELFYRGCEEMEELLLEADEASRLREKLGEPWEGSIGERLHSACERWSDLSILDRPSDQELAIALLRDLGLPMGWMQKEP